MGPDNNGQQHHRGRFASVGTSTRMDSLVQQQSIKSSRKSIQLQQAPPTQQMLAEPRNKRPFQHVEKMCSIAMAVLFLLFNALYWPWLLRDEDFDYAKFTATHQDQLKL